MTDCPRTAAAIALSRPIWLDVLDGAEGAGANDPKSVMPIAEVGAEAREPKSVRPNVDISPNASASDAAVVARPLGIAVTVVGAEIVGKATGGAVTVGATVGTDGAATDGFA